MEEKQSEFKIEIFIFSIAFLINMLKFNLYSFEKQEIKENPEKKEGQQSSGFKEKSEELNQK